MSFSMPRYQICRLALESNIPLPELRTAVAGEELATFELRSQALPEPAPQQWSHHWQFPDGQVSLSIADYDYGYLLRFPEKGDFHLSADGARIRGYAPPDRPLATTRHLLLDQVIPLALSLRGKLVMHASAVALPSGAVVLVGATGLGKSTLTASFCRQGFPLVADDGLVLEKAGKTLQCVPSYPGLRLWDDSLEGVFGLQPDLPPVAHYTTKMRLDAERGGVTFCEHPLPVRRIYFLTPAEQDGGSTHTTISPIPATQGFMELVRHAYCLDTRDQSRLRDRFQDFRQVVGMGLLRRLAYPRDLSLLPEVRRAILQDIGREENI